MSNNELATYENDNQIAAQAAVESPLICTVDANDNAGKTTIYNAVNNAEPLNSHMNEDLMICDCITERGIRRGRNGMPDQPCVNTYLIDVDGVAYFSQSDGVARSVYTLVTLWDDFGKSTDAGYLMLRCIEKPLQNGNTVKNLVKVN